EMSTCDGVVFNFLGECGSVRSLEGRSKLWRYNFHYHNDLNAQGAQHRKALLEDLINNWIKVNPPGVGDGWEPYCLSLRVVNWVKFLSKYPECRMHSGWTDSLLMQGHYLE